MPEVKQLKDKNSSVFYPQISKDGLVEPINGSDVPISAIAGLNSANVQGALAELVDNMDKPTYIVTFTAAGWTGSAAPYTQTVTVAGVTEDQVPVVGPNITTNDAATANSLLDAFSKVRRYTTNNGSITGYCYEDEKPEVDYQAIFKVL